METISHPFHTVSASQMTSPRALTTPSLPSSTFRRTTTLFLPRCERLPCLHPLRHLFCHCVLIHRLPPLGPGEVAAWNEEQLLLFIRPLPAVKPQLLIAA
jgi:hypothetical protein